MTCHHPEAICLPKKRKIELDLQEGDEISISSSSSLESLTKPFSTDQTPAPVIESAQDLKAPIRHLKEST